MATKEPAHPDQQAVPVREQPPKIILVERADGKGTGYIAACRIEPGEVILIDSPLLLYPTSLKCIAEFCSSCFRVLPPAPLYICQNCKKAQFCSARCLTKSHPTLLCQALPSLSSEGACPLELLFLLTAYSCSSDEFRMLQSLLPKSTNIDDMFVKSLNSKMEALFPGGLSLEFSDKLTTRLLSIDRSHAIPFYDPRNLRFDVCGEGGVRAYGLWLGASRFNHHCLPNASFFRYVDEPEQQNSTNLICRAIHEILKGDEICVSYVALNTEYLERKTILMDDYGFECNCARCIFESQDKIEKKVDHKKKKTEEKWKVLPDIVVSGYLSHYMCDCEYGGSLAPLPPLDARAALYSKECNLCGKTIKR